MLIFEKITMQLIKFITDYYPVTDCNPIGQRPPIHEDVKNDKNIGIIQTIMLGIDVGNITLVDVSTEPTKWHYESVDGGHRKRAIASYFHNEFQVNGKYYSELSESEKDIFKNYEIGITLYQELPNHMKGQIFRVINKTTDVNHQETLNSFGDLDIANAVRETVRPISYRGKISMPHDLFEKTAAGNFKWLDNNNNNKRLKLEEFVTRFYYRFYAGGDVGSRTFEELQTMFKDEDIKVRKLKKQVDALLDYLFEMAKARKATYSGKMAKGEMNTLANLYLWIEANYGNCDVEDPMEFYRMFSEVYSDYYHDAEYKYQDIIDDELRVAIGEHEVSSIMTLFRAYVNDQNSYKKQEQLMKWITADFDPTKHIIIKDKTRAFPRFMKEIALQQQNHVCAVDGLPLTWDEADAGHIIAHADGGKTELENCAMIRKIHNSKMGTMSVTEYTKVYNDV